MQFTEHTTVIAPALGALVDVDVDEHGDWVGVFRVDNALSIGTSKRTRRLSLEIQFPLVRRLDDRRFVVVDQRTSGDTANAWIVDFEETRDIPFRVGDGVQDVLACEDRIVVTYFDEGIFRGDPISREGVAVFDGRGELIGGYRSRLGSRAVDVCDCYAACWHGKESVAFSAYTDFHLVVLDIESFNQRVLSTPKRVHASSALSTAGDVVIFHGPHNSLRSQFAWALGSEDGAVWSVGDYHGRLRGLPGGRFLGHDARSFVVVESTTT